MSQDILEKIVRPEYKAQLRDWWKYANEKERIGLEVVGEIYATKGKKAVHVQLPQEKAMYETHHSLLSKWKAQNS